MNVRPGRTVEGGNMPVRADNVYETGREVERLNTPCRLPTESQRPSVLLYEVYFGPGR